MSDEDIVIGGCSCGGHRGIIVVERKQRHGSMNTKDIQKKVDALKVEAYEYMEEFTGDMYHDVMMVHEAVMDYDDGDKSACMLFVCLLAYDYKYKRPFRFCEVAAREMLDRCSDAEGVLNLSELKYEMIGAVQRGKTSLLISLLIVLYDGRGVDMSLIAAMYI